MKCEQCTFSQEPVEDSLQTLSLDIPQWLQSNGNPIHVKSLENEQQKDGFPNWLCGKEMLETSTHPNTPNEWIASMQDSLAKILVLLESKQVSGKEPAAGFTEKSCVLLAQLDPRYIFLENVAAIKSNGLETVVKDLACMGYDSRWLCIRASDVGAPHHRDRWFLLAHANLQHGQRGSQSQQSQCDSGETWSKPSGSSTNVADTDSAPCKGNECTKRIYAQHTNIDSASWWETEPNVGRVANGVAARVDKLKAIGNGQVPLQVATAFTILASE